MLDRMMVLQWFICMFAMERRHEYATLSYYWGGLQNITTTTENIDTRIKGILMHDLPQTIWDTVTVASVSKNFDTYGSMLCYHSG